MTGQHSTVLAFIDKDKEDRSSQWLWWFVRWDSRAWEPHAAQQQLDLYLS